MKEQKEQTSYELLGKDPAWLRKLLFAGVFIQENKLHAVFDRYSKISCKQWLLLAVITGFDAPPDLTQIAQTMGCSRQNVKQLARALESDGYITLEKSPKDSRALCVRLTDRGSVFRQEMDMLAGDVHNALFSEFTEEEIAQYYQMSVKLMHGIDHLEAYFMEKNLTKNLK